MMKMVIVDWIDAYGPVVEWGTLPTNAEQTRVTSMGYMIEFPETDSIVLIPNYIAETEQCFGNTVIPKGCIRTIIEVTLGALDEPVTLTALGLPAG
jgi:hypothetical protein